MTVAAAIGGPVSSFLGADLREATRKHGVVIWLDADGHYTDFVDRLAQAGDPRARGYEIRVFRGSYLALMMSLDGVASGADRSPLLVHLPGFNEDTVRHSPLLELYEAGTRYRKALGTLITEAASGRVRPEQIAAFRDAGDVTLDRADAWLSRLLDDGQGGISVQLRAMQPVAVFDDLLGGGFVAGRLDADPNDIRALWEQLAVWTGLPAAWRDATLPLSQPRAQDVAFAAASWVLAVEYVHDLKRPPVNAQLGPAGSLPPAVIDTCREIATHLRARHESFYERTADETEAILADEVEAARAEDLGRIDTFRFEEDKVLEGALAALGAAEWSRATEWAAPRTGLERPPASFWVRRDAPRQAVWDLVLHAARLGQAITSAGDRLSGAGSVDGALEAYVEHGAAVDRAHRHLEQRRAAVLYPQLPWFATLRMRLDEMRRRWRRWADAWARDFNVLCLRHGFLPGAAHQQRTIFDDTVRPMTQDAGTTAYFVVDAFRFEMGEELAREIRDTPATSVQLKARLAELPTITAVGMNVLPPVAANGRLTPSFAASGEGRILGFSTGAFRVVDAETRRRAMHDRVGGTACPWLTLEEVVERDTPSLKRAIAQARLVVVHNREIDSAGEGGVGPVVFDQVLQRLRAAWHLLREAGVRRFVFTADHGFLLLDDSAGSVQSHGRWIDPKRRHVLSPIAADHDGEARVALADLGYEGAGGHLMFPETTAVFDTGKRSMSFVHGGNSLQERVIPVLTVVHRAAAGGSTLRYVVHAEAREAVAGMHCLQVMVEVAAQAALDFGNASAIELSLRTPDDEDVQVELCQTRGNARLAAGAVQAGVGEPFELFFRLSGPSDARVRVELFHPGGVADLASRLVDARFTVSAANQLGAATAAEDRPGRSGWLNDLPEGGVRQIFEHLAAHGTVTEQEAAAMLGGARGLRRFAVQFEALVARAPWGVRIEVVNGVKRYVREGGSR